MIPLDATDKKIIQLLQQDCKQTHKELSNALNLSVTAVYERIKKLERQGVISQYVAVVDKKKIDLGFVVFSQIKLVQHAKSYVLHFEREVAKLPEVLACYHVSGDFDYLLHVVVKDMEAFREFMVKKLTTIKYIGSTHSAFVISEVKHTTALPLETN
jgi:Lrp/AsnC family leucine-responsive transcriptional regulator